MITIERISGAAAIRYYSTLSRTHEYYSDDDKCEGRWFGGAVRALGLEGPVEEKVFRNLLNGFSIDGTETWVRGPQDPKLNRRAGIECGIHAPKSVSALWSQASHEDRRRILNALERAVDSTLRVFQDFCGAARRGHNGIIQENAKLLAAVFRHETARPIPGEVPDPQLHWHCVFLNMAVREDGTIGAWDARPIFRRGMRHALSALFRAEASRELREIGLESYRPEKEGKPGEKEWWFELTSVPTPLVEEMSKRRKQVETWLRKRGLSGSRASQLAALETREDKRDFSSKELDDAWHALGQKHRFRRLDVRRAFGKLPEVDKRRATTECLERALKVITKSQARFSELELLRVMAEEAQCTGIGISEVRGMASFALEHSHQIIHLRDVDGERQWTTKEMLQVERRMLKAASCLNKRAHLSLNYDEISNVASKFPTLRTEQRAGLWRLCVGQDLACVNGISGAGKTFLLKTALAAWESKGFTVRGTTLSANASQVLQEESGIQSVHVHELLRLLESGRIKLDRNTVLVCDEAGMLGTIQLEKITSLVEQAGAKLCLIGDHTQLAAIDAGAPFRVIAEREGVTELLEIVRQKEKWQQRLVKDLRSGRSGSALQALDERGLLFVGQEREETLMQMVADWAKRAIREGELSESMMFAGTNAACRELNYLAQEARLQAGELGYVFLQYGDYELRKGDLVIATRNHRQLGIRNGMRGIVVDIEDGKLRVQLEKGHRLLVDAEEYEHFKLAYSLSVHKAQGLSIRYSFLLFDQTMSDREQAYVGGSRFKDEARFYCDLDTAGSSLEGLSRIVHRTRGKDLAHEHLLEHELEVA